MIAVVSKVFPFMHWFEGYSMGKFKLDMVAGLTVALVLIPQSMAYAQLAGLPAYYGLYASFLPPMIAALFGSSRQLATGPVAVVSLMTAASLEPLATAGSDAFVMYAILLALTVGVFQLMLGVLRLGLVVNFLSHPVVNGFTNAAAIIIATSQFSKLFGVYVDKAAHHYETIWRVCQAAMHFTYIPALLMAVLAFVIMYGLKKVNPRIPNVLVAVVVTTLLSWMFGFEHNYTGSVDQIMSPEVRTSVAGFNAAVSDIAHFGEERALRTAELGRIKEKTGLRSIDYLDKQHEVDIIGAKIDQAKSRAHLYRHELRQDLLVAVEEPDGILRFYLKDTVPDDTVTDGRTWRLKVGNSLLRDDAILFTGGGAVVGEVPRGLPTMSFPRVNLGTLLSLLPFAAIISLLGFMEAISIAKAMAAKTGQRLDPNQELIGQGLANIIGAFGKSYPASGSFSRSAVNLQAGAVSGFSSVITSLTVVIALLFFTPLLYHLPQAVLASVIMMAVMGLINVSGFVHAWKAQWYDGAISVFTFFCTLAFAPHLDKGIMVGVALSLGVFLYKSMRPKVAKLAMDKDSSLQCVDASMLDECKYIAIIRFDGPLFFANASYLEDQVTSIMRAMPDLKHIHISASGINDMDASGEEALSLLVERIRSRGCGISFSGVKERVLGVMKRTHLYEKIGEENIFSTLEGAIQRLYVTVHPRDLEGSPCGCPLMQYIPRKKDGTLPVMG